MLTCFLRGGKRCFQSTPVYSGVNSLFHNERRDGREEGNGGHGQSYALSVLLCLPITQTRTLSKRPRRAQFKCIHSVDGLASRGLRAAAGLSERIMFMVHCQLEPSRDFWPKQGEPHARGSTAVVVVAAAVIHRYGHPSPRWDAGTGSQI